MEASKDKNALPTYVKSIVADAGLGVGDDPSSSPVAHSSVTQHGQSGHSSVTSATTTRGGGGRRSVREIEILRDFTEYDATIRGYHTIRKLLKPYLGSSQVESVRNLEGFIGSGEEEIFISEGSGRVTDPVRPARSDPIRPATK